MADHSNDHIVHKHPAFIDLHARAFSDFREVTGLTRPSKSSPCQLGQVVSGLYIGKYEEIKDPNSLSNLSPPVALVVNAGAANDQCPTKTGFYGPAVLVLRIDLLDEPTAGDAKQYFRSINANIRSTIVSGKSVVVHCAGSISRASVLVIAYLMQTMHLSAFDAATILKRAWDVAWPCDAFVHQLLEFQAELIAAERLITGPKRPPGNHGCPLAEIIPGLVNVHFNDIRQPDSIARINASGAVSRPITLVVNSSVANKQCDTYPGFYGPGVEVLGIDLLDDPKEGGPPRLSPFFFDSVGFERARHRKRPQDRGGRRAERVRGISDDCCPHRASTARRSSGEAHKWPGNSAPFYRATNAKIRAHLSAGNAAVVHCMASLSRSIVFVCAYLMEAERMTLLQALVTERVRACA